MKKILIAGVVTLCIFYLLLAAFVGLNVYKDDKKMSDVVIILGARSYKNNEYNPCLVERVRHGVDLYNKGYGTYLLMTGGTDKEDGKNEAVAMEEIGQNMNVDPAKILLEKKSTSTYENLLFSKQLMDEKHLKSAIIVTEPFHSPRAGLIAKKLGIHYTVSPTLTSQCWNRWKYISRYFLKEPFAIIQYWMEGRI